MTDTPTLGFTFGDGTDDDTYYTVLQGLIRPGYVVAIDGTDCHLTGITRTHLTYQPIDDDLKPVGDERQRPLWEPPTVIHIY